MPPNISSRAFIQWLPDGARSEPTSTLVVTSSQRRFADIRMLIPPQQCPEELEEETRNHKQTQQRTPSHLPSQIDWAFAGTSTSTTDKDNKHLSRWHHWVDSTTLRPEEVVDKGEMLPEDPSSGLSLEKGEMVNPDTGVLTGYVEGWRDVEPLATPFVGEEEVKEFLGGLKGRGVVVDGFSLGGGEDGGFEDRAGRLSLVMRHENVSKGSRGMVVRVGHVCQGVLRVGDEFGLERWVWEENGWRREFGVGNLFLPCDVLNLLGERVGLHTEVRYGEGEDFVWKCLEAEGF